MKIAVYTINSDVWRNTAIIKFSSGFGTANCGEESFRIKMVQTYYYIYSALHLCNKNSKHIESGIIYSIYHIYPNTRHTCILKFLYQKTGCDQIQGFHLGSTKCYM
jgi:hypothetical protein